MNKIAKEDATIEGPTASLHWNASHGADIGGFATNMSVKASTRVDFKINASGGANPDYKAEIFSLVGYHGGRGAREVDQRTNTNATLQPKQLVDASRGTEDTGNRSLIYGWNVPVDATSSVHLACLQRLYSSSEPIEVAAFPIPSVVRSDGESHETILQTSYTTWQTYNIGAATKA